MTSKRCVDTVNDRPVYDGSAVGVGRADEVSPGGFAAPFEKGGVGPVRRERSRDVRAWGKGRTSLSGQLREFLEADPEIARQVVRVARLNRPESLAPVDTVEMAFAELGESTVRAMALTFARTRHGCSGFGPGSRPEGP